MNLIAPTFNQEGEILRGKGENLKSVPSSSTDNFSHIMEGLLLSDPCIPDTADGVVAGPEAIPEFKELVLLAGQIEEGLAKTPTREMKDDARENYREKGYPLDEEKFILHYIQGGATPSGSLYYVNASPAQEEERKPEQSLDQIKRSLIDLAEDMSIKPEKNQSIHQLAEESPENLLPNQQIEQRAYLQHQETPANNLPENLLAKLEINLNTAEKSTVALPRNLSLAQGISPGHTESSEEGQSADLEKILTNQVEKGGGQQGQFSTGHEKPVIALQGDPPINQGIVSGHTESSEEGQSADSQKILTNQVEREGRQQGQFSAGHEKPVIALQGDPPINQGIVSGHTESSEEGPSADLQKILTNQIEREGGQRGQFSTGHEKPIIALPGDPSLEKGIKPDSARGSEESLSANPQETLTEPAEKMSLLDKADKGEIFYSKDLLAEYKLKPETEALEKGPLSAHAVKPFREVTELTANNPGSKDSPNTVANSSYNNILGEKVLDQVVKFARLNLKESMSEVEIHLKPELLGSLKIKVAMEGQEIRASFFADTLIVKEIIENHLPSLRQAFLAQNLDIDKFSVFVGYHQGRENMDSNNLKDFPKDKEGHRSKGGKKILPLQEQRQPEYHGLNLIDCFV